MENHSNHQEPNKDNHSESEQPSQSYGSPSTGFTPVVEPEQIAPPKHSGLGIASFVIFVVMVVGFIGLLVTFISLMSDFLGPDGAVDPLLIQEEVVNVPMLSLVGLLMMGTVLGYIVGLILGIVGLVQKNRKKIFAILGTVFNGLAVGLVLFLLLLGLIVGAAA